MEERPPILSPALRAVLLVGLKEKAADPDVRLHAHGFLDHVDDWSDEQLAIEGRVFLGTDFLLPEQAAELEQFLSQLDLRLSGR